MASAVYDDPVLWDEPGSTSDDERERWLARAEEAIASGSDYAEAVALQNGRRLEDVAGREWFVAAVADSMRGQTATPISSYRAPSR